MVRKILEIIVILTLSNILVFSASAQQEDPVRQLMLKQFDRPESKLTIAAVVIDSHYAIASWIQDGRGGRALLRNKHGAWSIILCSGESLRQSERLIQIGMGHELANRLAQSLVKAEASLTAHDRHLLDTFEGDVLLDGGDHPTVNPQHNAQTHKH